MDLVDSIVYVCMILGCFLFVKVVCMRCRNSFGFLGMCFWVRLVMLFWLW